MFIQISHSTRTAPLIQAAMRNRLDVMQLLIEYGADLEIKDRYYGTPVYAASNSYKLAAAKLLLEHGADVNQRQKHGRTALFVAIITKQLSLVELLLSYGADVNMFAHYKDKWGRYHNEIDGYTPLHAALKSFSNIGFLDSPEKSAPDFAAHLAILKLLVPLCDSFDLIISEFPYSTYRIEPCVVRFFHTELDLGWDDDFTTTKYLLRNGAVANFSQFFDCLFEHKSSFKPLTTSLLKLFVLAGCKFDTDFTAKMQTKEELLWFDEHIQPVLDKVEALFSQPLTLQELSIMSIRQCIGSRQLWAKIDSLPDGIPRSVKDMIQLKTCSPDKNGDLYVNSGEPLAWHCTIFCCPRVPPL